MLRSPWVKRAVSLVPFLVPVLLLLPEGDYVAIYDGREYADCIVKMATQPSLANLSCSGHPTQAYTGFAAAIQALSPYSPWLMLVSHLALLLAAVWAFARSLERLFPDPDAWLERALVVLAMAINPVLLSCALQPSPEIAVVAGTLLLLAALLARRMVAASLAGLFLAFSTELGILDLPTLVALYACVHITRTQAPAKQKRRDLLALWPTLVPMAAVLARIIFIRVTSGAEAFNAPPPRPPGALAILAELLTVKPLDGTFLSYAAGITVLQFQWLQTIVLVACASVMFARWLFGKPSIRPGVDSKSTGMALALFAAAFVITTRYKTYSSPRYWASAYPLMAMATYAATRELGFAVRARQAFFAVVGVASLASVFYTVDPLSKKLYGTFAFGRHTMLSMTSITQYEMDSTGGHGRDQIVYNLQFASTHHLQNAILEHLPSPPLLNIVDKASGWRMWGPLDESRRRTLDPRGQRLPQVVVPRIFDRQGMRAQQTGLPWLFHPGPPLECSYVVYPMFEPVQRPIEAELLKTYDVVQRTKVERDGYEAEVLTLRLNEKRWAAFSATPDADR
jgi:hypothetical protein